MQTELLENLAVTGVHSASTMFTPASVKTRKKDRPRWAVVLKYEGETVYTSGGKRFVSDLHHVVILPKGCCYEWQCTESGHFAIIEFESAGSYPEALCFPVKNGQRLLRLFQEMEYKRNLRKPMYEMESVRDLYTILLQLNSDSPDRYIAGTQQKKILPAVEFISQNYSKNITNDMLAEAAGMSTVYFRKLFTAAMGISPIAYTKQLRIEKAKEMLKSDYGTLSDVAQSLGYANLYDFSRDFKKHTGVAPSKYESL